MPILQVYVSKETLEILRRAAIGTGRATTDLAEAAVESAALDYNRSHPKPSNKESRDYDHG